MATDNTPTPPVWQPLSKCHLANKTAVHTEPEQNTASSIHTVTANLSNKRCHLLKNWLIFAVFFFFPLFFLLLLRAENVSPPIKEGIVANMADIPVLLPILCESE